MRDILEVAYDLNLPLEPAGEEYRCCCRHPGHNDTNASLYVNPNKQNWYCFGCTRGGSAYGLVLWMKPEMSRAEALSLVAGEDGAASFVLHTIRQITQVDMSKEEGSALFSLLMRKYAGHPVEELPVELIDALWCEEPLQALNALVAV